MRRRAAVAVAALGLAVVAGACLQPAAGPTGAGSPRPATSAPAPPPPAAACGDPTASLRPLGPRPQPMAMPAGSFMRAIQDRGQLVAGVSRDTMFLGYLRPADHRLEGFDVDLVKQVSRAIFGDENHVKYRVVSEAEAAPMLQQGAVDVVVRTLAITCQGWRQVDFTTEYLHVVQRLLVARSSAVQGIDDLRGRPVCAADGSLALAVVRAAASHPVATPAADWTECLVRFQQGDVDAVSADDAVLLGLAEQDPNATIVGDGLADASYGMAVSKAHPDFVRFLNATLEQVRADGRWTSLHDRWLGRLGPAPAPPAGRYRD